jgi:hypothetical protein
MKKFLLFLLIALVYLAHQDIWNWKSAEPLFLGFLPVGLAYHAGFSVLCAVLMALLVKVAWPEHLEAQDNNGEDIGAVRQNSTGPMETPFAGSVPASGVGEKAGIAGS